MRISFNVNCNTPAFIQNQKMNNYANLAPLMKDTVSFGTNWGAYRTEDGKIIATRSQLFREGIEWNKFPKTLEDRFKDKKQVNLISHACSDGSEAYSMAIMLIEKLGYERAKKFLPIKALDINKDIIDFAKSGYIELIDEDLECLEDLGIDPKKYFTYEQGQNIKTPHDYTDEDEGEFTTYRVSEKLRSCVEFQTGDVLDDLENLEDDSNTVLFFRNALFFLTPEDREKFLHKVDGKLNGKSLLVLGSNDYHYCSGVKKIPKKTGFAMIKNPAHPFKWTYSKEID